MLDAHNGGEFFREDLIADTGVWFNTLEIRLRKHGLALMGNLTQFRRSHLDLLDVDSWTILILFYAKQI